MLTLEQCGKPGKFLASDNVMLIGKRVSLQLPRSGTAAARGGGCPLWRQLGHSQPAGDAAPRSTASMSWPATKWGTATSSRSA